MVAKINAGVSLFSALAYNQNKVEKDMATVLFANKIIESASGNFDIPACLLSFEPYLAVNLKTEKPVLHISLNPNPKDNISDGEMSDIAQEYMQKLGYGNQPYIVYKHEDIERRHLHIVSVRVNENGRLIDDSFERRRSMQICREIEQKYNLIAADTKQREVFSPVKKIKYGNENLKSQLVGIIRPLAQNYAFQTMGEYKALLSLYNINVEETQGEAHGKSYHGVIYSAVDDNGIRIGKPFKSSLLGKNIGFESLSKKMEKSAAIIKNKNSKERAKTVVTKAMQNISTRKNFERALVQNGFDVVFRKNNEGRIYGVTFIDRKNCCVLNGSRLGKEFSANVFNNIFNENNIQLGNKNTIENAISFETRNNNFDEAKAVLGILSFENKGTDYEEEAFIMRMKKKKKRKK